MLVWWLLITSVPDFEDISMAALENGFMPRRGGGSKELDVHRPGDFLNAYRVHLGPTGRVPSPVPSPGKSFAHRTSQHAKKKQDICRISRHVETFISTFFGAKMAQPRRMK